MGNQHGFIWTLDREVAERLGDRAWTPCIPDKPLVDSEHRGRVAEKTIKKSEVIAYLTGREEAEIILIPPRGSGGKERAAGREPPW
jgi:alpha-L-fucosidase